MILTCLLRSVYCKISGIKSKQICNDGIPATAINPIIFFGVSTSNIHGNNCIKSVANGHNNSSVRDECLIPIVDDTNSPICQSIKAFHQTKHGPTETKRTPISICGGGRQTIILLIACVSSSFNFIIATPRNAQYNRNIKQASVMIDSSIFIC
ncbi:hypothetical protein DERP_007423 [Dermatophagoides pteronyssinus]|uniref:Uncharacterized protein n=1 Tax=Dermatophagoides pteronyssinus TaxID=6956 RepID=A0ABQ8J4F2_DERPT|nr:hypothetical protein DERP_007423 [Dermatophagoides pteronyssinus]